MITFMLCVLTFIVGHAIGYFWMKRHLRKSEFKHEHVWGNWEDSTLDRGNGPFSAQRRYCVGCNLKEVREVL